MVLLDPKTLPGLYYELKSGAAPFAVCRSTTVPKGITRVVVAAHFKHDDGAAGHPLQCYLVNSFGNGAVVPSTIDGQSITSFIRGSVFCPILLPETCCLEVNAGDGAAPAGKVLTLSMLYFDVYR